MQKCSQTLITYCEGSKAVTECLPVKFGLERVYDAVLSISFLAIFSTKYGVVGVRLTHSGLDDRDDIYEIITIHKNVPIFIISSFIFRWLYMKWF